MIQHQNIVVYVWRALCKRELNAYHLLPPHPKNNHKTFRLLGIHIEGLPGKTVLFYFIFMKVSSRVYLRGPSTLA